jgi:hypothetical protein
MIEIATFEEAFQSRLRRRQGGLAFYPPPLDCYWAVSRRRRGATLFADAHTFDNVTGLRPKGMARRQG